MMAKWFPIVMLMVAAPAPLLAQTQAQAQAGVQAQVQTPQARIDAALQAAVQADVPVSLLSSKVAEGEAKRVPRERIAAAVEARLTALLRAAGTLRRAEITNATAAEIAVTADALSAGVSETAVVQLSRTAPRERRVIAVAVLSDLVRLGHGNETALARVSAALGVQGTLANLQADVASSAALANLHAEVASQLHTQGFESTLDASGGVTVPNLPAVPELPDLPR